MKTFKDLEFKPHKTGEGLQARMDFDNDYGVSVVRFKINGVFGSYTDSDKEWELAVMWKGELTYTTPVTNDVIGHLSARAVTKIMKQVQLLPPRT